MVTEFDFEMNEFGFIDKLIDIYNNKNLSSLESRKQKKSFCCNLTQDELIILSKHTMFVDLYDHINNLMVLTGSEVWTASKQLAWDYIQNETNNPTDCFIPSINYKKTKNNI